MQRHIVPIQCDISPKICCIVWEKRRITPIQRLFVPIQRHIVPQKRRVVWENRHIAPKQFIIEWKKDGHIPKASLPHLKINKNIVHQNSIEWVRNINYVMMC